MRNLAAANLTETQAAHLIPLAFGEFQFDEGTERIHTGVGDFVWGGFTWTGIGDFGGVEPIEEAEVLSPFAVRVTLSGITSVLVTRAQNSDIYGRTMRIYVGFLSDGDLVADPDIAWSGTMDTMDVKRGKENEIALSGESELKFFEKRNNKRFNDEDQQLEFPGDLGFEYLDQMQEANVVWGGRNVNFASRPVFVPAEGGRPDGGPADTG